MNKSCIYYIAFIFILVSCDPGGSLVVKNGNGHSSRTVVFNGSALEFSLNTISNTNFSLKVKVSTEVNINIISDSLNIYHNQNEIDYEIRYDGDIYKSKIIEIKPGSEIFFYGFNLIRDNVKKGDEIILYAKNYIEKETNFFDLDTVKFIVTREY